jgi:hypothetical protein
VQIGVVALTSLLLVSGCESTYQKRSVTGSGFLSDYTQLTNRGGNTALLSYIAPGADLKPYSKILLEPVRAYVPSSDSPMAKLSKENRQGMVNYFDAALREKLNLNFELVHEPGPAVLRMRVAVTEAKGSAVLLDTVSTVVPLGLAISYVNERVTGKHLSVGEIGAECEVLDSVTGKRLLAAVDARVGNKVTFEFDKFGKWHTAKDAFDFWARQIHERLCELKGKAVQ